MKYYHNPNLKTILPGWKGNPVKDGTFQYHKEPVEMQPLNMLKWMVTPNPQRKEKIQDDFRPAQVFDASVLTRGGEDYIVWLGHASFLLQIAGVRFLTDPMFSSFPLRRLAPLPFEVSQLRHLDYLLISHDHRDHCDERSVKQLLQNNQPQFLTSLEMSSVIGGWARGNEIQEAGWFQVFSLPKANFEIVFLPTRHWCRRGLTDFNRRLWGAFLIRTADHTIYFGGDSAYGSHYHDTSELFPEIDLALLGIGAYKPEYMMRDVHTNPHEATQAFKDLKADKLIPMHYGTYDLSDEPLGEPYRKIKSQFEREGMTERLLLPPIGKKILL